MQSQSPAKLLQCCGSGATSHSCANGYPEAEPHAYEVTYLHAVCKNPEKQITWRGVLVDSDLSLARYTYADPDEAIAITSCAKECAAEAKCVAFQLYLNYSDDGTFACAPAHVHICTAALHFYANPCCCAACSLCQCWRCESMVLKAPVQWVVLGASACEGLSMRTAPDSVCILQVQFVWGEHLH
jgi:hypothetical protein